MSSLSKHLRSLKKIPGFRELAAWRTERQSNALFEHIGLAALQQQLLKTLGSAKIARGPFAGMKYLPASSGSVLGAKLLGCYEAELHGPAHEVIARNPDVIVDVGSAEGYYAVGFAWLLARSGSGAGRVVAFDGNFIARRRTAQLAELNSVRERLDIEGFASHAALERALAPALRGVVWCDIEGGEHFLIDPEKIPSLRRAFIVIETHESLSGFPAQMIADRFLNTHKCERIAMQPRNAADWFSSEQARLFRDNEKELLMSEMRSVPTDWLVLRPN